MCEIILESKDYLIGSFEGYLNGTVHSSFTKMDFMSISYVIFIFIRKSGIIYFVYESGFHTQRTADSLRCLLI